MHVVASAFLLIGRADVVRLLLAQDNIEANRETSDDGATPFLIACDVGNVEIVKLLLAHQNRYVGAPRGGRSTGTLHKKGRTTGRAAPREVVDLFFF